MLDKIKINNIKRIMLTLLRRKHATKTGIVTDTGLSNSTVSSCVNSLLELKLLVVDGMEDSAGGRRSSIYRINGAYGRFIGVDMRKDAMVVVVTDCENHVLSSTVYPFRADKPTINCLLEVLDTVLAQNENVLGIGIGLSGSLDHQEQVVISNPDYEWQFVHLKEIVERQYLIFTYIDHRVNGAAVSEGMVGSACEQENYLYIGENSGEKAALVLNSQLCRGVDNTTGQIPERELNRLMSSEMLNFLGVSSVLIGYRTEGFKDKLYQSISDFTGEIICIRQTNDTYPAGMAAITQREWFESIYFML